MTKRIGSSRRKTRHTLSVPKKLKGKLNINLFMQKLSPGDKVVFMASPSIHKGIYYRRFHGKTGSVIGAAGSCYKVSVRDKGLEKTLIVSPVHLAKVKNGAKDN